MLLTMWQVFVIGQYRDGIYFESSDVPAGTSIWFVLELPDEGQSAAKNPYVDVTAAETIVLYKFFCWHQSGHGR